MSEDFDFSKHRNTMRDKAKRLASGGDPHERVDGSSWTPDEPLHAEAKTGMRPISRRQFKKGGKVEGEREKMRADRKPRKNGGKAIADAYMNRDQREANDERPGVKHVGGFKRGGRTKKADGGSFVPTERMAFSNGPSQMSKAAGYKNGGMPKEYDPAKAEIRRLNRGAPGVTQAQASRINRLAKQDKPQGYKNGGHPDEKEDRKLVKTMVKKPALTGKKKGGGVSVLDGGHNDGDRQARKHGGRADAHWIKGALAGGHKGALHKELNVADDKRIPQKKLERAEHSSNKLVAKRAHLAETLEHMNKPEKASGGRMARAEGGRTKGKTNINIVIAQPRRDEGSLPDQGPRMAPPPSPRPPMPPPAQLGGTLMPPPMPPQGGGGPPPMGMPPGMPRKDGGRTVKVAHDMAEDGGGAGSGLGRLEKVRSYGHRA